MAGVGVGFAVGVETGLGQNSTKFTWERKQGVTSLFPLAPGRKFG